MFNGLALTTLVEAIFAVFVLWLLTLPIISLEFPNFEFLIEPVDGEDFVL